ncbi:MAG: HAD family hydrolase [Synergistaceae bacterium]|jgi:D-glycero-D-manno-heptose 1,7-bisphosphate phosphatase|nr:HAD family hydrolase [Synergistaceae bacterium]
MAKNKAAFFDRDGTINVDTVHTYKTEELRFIVGVPELIRRYNDKGFLVIVITNQSGIARGLFTETDMRKFHEYMNWRLNNEYGAHIDAFYFCPHHPDFTGDCECRKPKPGLIQQAIRDFNICVEQSVMFGDSDSDVKAATATGVRAVLINSLHVGGVDEKTLN